MPKAPPTMPGCSPSAALVLMMTGPGLALFYGGLVRKKNVLGTMMQSFAMMAIVTITVGDLRLHAGFRRRQQFYRRTSQSLSAGVGAAPDPDYAATIPAQTFMVYQLMFAIITPALITGAFAERMKFSAMAVFMVLWSIVVYSPDGPHGLGQGRTAERFTGRALSYARFRRRDGRPHYVRSFCPGMRAVSRQTSRISQTEHASA